MNDIDRRLSDYAERWRAQQAPPPAPEVPMRSRIPRWIPAVAAAAAVILVAGGVAYAVTTLNDDGNTGTPAVQPSITPVDLTGAVPFTDAAPDHSLQPCTPTTIAGGAGMSEGAAGTTYYNFTVTNTGAAACALTNNVSMILHADGQPDVTAASAQHTVTTTTLRPGGVATVPLAVPTLCQGADPAGGAPAQTYTDVAIVLGDQGTETVPGQSIAYYGCVAQTQPFTIDNSNATTGGNPTSNLDINLELPSGLVSGGTLVYVVDLSNPTQHTIDFSGACPAYTQQLSDPASNAVASGTYALNCEAFGNVISPGAMTRFEMRLDIPSGTLAGPHVLNWYFRGLDKPGAKTSIDVVAP
jgi:hypothetical protein